MVEVEKRAGVAGCGSLGRGVYNIMAALKGRGTRWSQPETAVETCPGHRRWVGCWQWAFRGPTALGFWNTGDLGRLYRPLARSVGALYWVSRAWAQGLSDRGRAVHASTCSTVRGYQARRCAAVSKAAKRMEKRWPEAEETGRQRANGRPAIRASGWGGQLSGVSAIGTAIGRRCLAESLVQPGVRQSAVCGSIQDLSR